MKVSIKFYLCFLVLIQPFLYLDVLANENQVTLDLRNYNKKIIVAKVRDLRNEISHLFAMRPNTSQTLVSDAIKNYKVQEFAMLPYTSQVLVSDAIINYKVQDINLDGNDELLVEASVGGVSCCPPRMLIYFYNNQEGLLEEFVFEEWVLGHGWRAVDIKLENKSAILTGTNTYYGSKKLKHITTSYIFDGDAIFKYSIKEKLELPSIIEIRSEDYLNQNEIEYDINNDGYKEKVICDYWHRWNSLSNCKIKFSNSYEIALEGYGGKRLGILPSKKNGMNMLVFNHDTILFFNKANKNYSALNK